MDLQGPNRHRDVPSGAILSLDQIKALRSCNEYTEGPAVARRPAPVPRHPTKHERTHEVILVNVNNNYERRSGRPPTLSRSTSTGSSGSGTSSAGSEQNLLTRSPPIRSQPTASRDILIKSPKLDSAHQFICESCGKCKCTECRTPRPLPACLACNGQCLCSAQSLVEHGTCMCLVKGVFYHCSKDEDDVGDACADRPCSLTHPRCCSRFLCMGLMGALFPCLLCYLPARGCVRACDACYDRATRPGCRCKNSNTVYCKLQSWSGTITHTGSGKPS